MSARVISIDPDTDPRWDAFVAQQPRATIWHSSGWLGVIRRTFGYELANLAYVVDRRAGVRRAPLRGLTLLGRHAFKHVG